jgi:hypothetical protein
MADQQRPQPSDTGHPHDANLPVPAGDRGPATVADATARDLARLPARALEAGPALAASIVGAAAAAAVTGAAVAARLLWPWVTAGWRPSQQPEPPRPFSSGWVGPGFSVRYTHIEIHWPGER